MDYLDSALTTIADSGFLSAADFLFLTDCQTELQDTWRKQQVFRTETEMRVGVLDDFNFPTRAAKYWQCVREQGVFFEQLVLMGFEYRRNEAEIRRLTDSRKLAAADDYERELMDIDIEERLFKRLNLERIAADRIRELRLWSRLKQELDDGSFDTGDVNTHQMEALQRRLDVRASHAGMGSIDEACNVFGQIATARRVAAGLPPG
jgi:hypothetical protein